MNKDTVFVDTNIILDWLGERAPFFKFAKALFLKAEKGESARVIITRNLKDFVNVQIPIMSAEDYIKSTQKE